MFLRTNATKESPDRYSLFLDTGELVGEPDEDNLVLLDSSKNLSLYPLKDMVRYLFDNYARSNSMQDRLELQKTRTVFGVEPKEFDLVEDKGITSTLLF